jgi:hypothetical protein
MFRSSLLWFNK